jgi:hypothetical protein
VDEVHSHGRLGGAKIYSVLELHTFNDLLILSVDSVQFLMSQKHHLQHGS